MLQDDWLDERRTEEIAHKVREELARRRISRQALADMARISISTLEKALAGRRSFTLATVIRLEEALDIQEAALGPHHLATGETLCRLAQAHAALERWDQALKVQMRAMKVEDGLTSALLAVGSDRQRGEHIARLVRSRDALLSMVFPHLHGSQDAVPSSTSSPTRKRRPFSATSGMPDTTRLRRRIAGATCARPASAAIAGRCSAWIRVMPRLPLPPL